jgi:hypothetical protein
LIPRLHAFYGPADPEYGSWPKVPQWLLRCYWEMLPRLEARRELAAIQQGHAFVERPLEARDHREYIRELRKRARIERPQPITVDHLAAFGIEVEKG